MKKYIKWAVGAVIIALLFSFPRLFNDRYFIQIATMMGIISIASLGLNLIFGYTGQISLGHAAFYAIGAYSAVIAENWTGLSFWLATPLAVAVCALVGLTVGVPILRLRHHYLAMATLGLGIIVEVILTQWSDVTGGAVGIFNIKRPVFAGEELAETGYYYLVLAALLLSLTFVSNLINSRVGRALIAVRENEDAAGSLGINIARHKNIAFVISTAMAGLAGSLYAHLNQFISPETFTMRQSIQFLAMIVIGGLGSNAGAIVGAVTLTILPELLYGFEDYSLIVYGIILLLFMIFLPDGLIGLYHKLSGLKTFAVPQNNQPELAGKAEEYGKGVG